MTVTRARLLDLHNLSIDIVTGSFLIISRIWGTLWPEKTLVIILSTVNCRGIGHSMGQLFVRKSHHTFRCIIYKSSETMVVLELLWLQRQDSNLQLLIMGCTLNKFYEVNLAQLLQDNPLSTIYHARFFILTSSLKDIFIFDSYIRCYSALYIFLSSIFEFPTSNTPSTKL